VPEPPSFDLILAAETKRMPLASKIVKITDVTMETTVTTPRAAQSICIRRRSSAFVSWPSWAWEEPEPVGLLASCNIWTHSRNIRLFPGGSGHAIMPYKTLPV